MNSSDKKLCIAMVGLPGMGKSTVAAKLQHTLKKDGKNVRIFNNGDVRREMLAGDTAYAEFYAPENSEGLALRENIALINMRQARDFLDGRGQVAIIDATNSSRHRRHTLTEELKNYPILFVECQNDDPELLAASVSRKIRGAEFVHLPEEEARRSFEKRIEYYRKIAQPLEDEDKIITLDTLNNRIVREEIKGRVPYYGLIRDMLMSDWVKSMFVCRHGESWYNIEGRIGGDSKLSVKGLAQSGTMAAHFREVSLPYIFTSTKLRTKQMAEPLIHSHPEATVMALPEFDEIDAGKCEEMTYDEFEKKMPDEFEARKHNKFSYSYPEGESYATLGPRVEKGLKKALYLSGNSENIMIIGHQAVNRMILSHFLYRRQEDVPFIYIPQNKYFHIVSTQVKKLLELKNY